MLEGAGEVAEPFQGNRKIPVRTSVLRILFDGCFKPSDRVAIGSPAECIDAAIHIRFRVVGRRAVALSQSAAARPASPARDNATPRRL